MRRAKHLTPTKYGTLAHIRIQGTLYQKHFPTGTDPIDMRAWIVDRELEHRKGPSGVGAFDMDAARYLAAVSAMRSFSDRKRDIQAWVKVFADTTRSVITSAVISSHLQTWRQTLSASSCNSRRAALQHLFTTLDGKGAKNPVRDVPKFPLPQLAPRALDYATIRKILSKVPKGKDRARLAMIAYTGLPHSIIGQLTAGSFDKERKELSVPGRRKGSGTRGRTLPLTRQGVAAVKLMIATKAWGAFPRYHLRWVFHQACDAAGVDRARPYDLRHSFGTEVYRQSGDPRAVQELMLHASDAMGKRYTLAAVPERLRKAVKGFGR